MADIFEKCKNFKEAKRLMELGIYGYFQPISSAQGPEVILKGKKYIMAGSNNYLGLANDPKMKEAALEAITKYGTGSAGSRFLNGNTVAAEELEAKLAKFKGKEAGIIFSAGYQMNLGVISSLLKKGDVAIVDKLDHASILDGVKLSEAEMVRFKHNDMKDLEIVLSKIPEEKGKLIIVDGVFSMEGDICNLPEIVKLANFDKKYEGIANFPAVTRDISILVPKTVLAGEVEDVIVKNAGKNLESYNLFDVYEGAQVGLGFKSMAYTITFRAKDRTLEEKEISASMDKIVNALKDKGITLRG